MIKWIYIFGSCARNEQDEYSDLDILEIWQRNKKASGYSYTDIEKKYCKKASKSIYNIDTIVSYFIEGHPFAWHIYSDAILLYSYDDRDILRSLGKPAKYKNLKNDYNSFLKILKGIPRSIQTCEGNLVYEAGNFYTILRNIYFYNNYIRSGIMDFDPFIAYKKSEVTPVSKEEYKNYRMAKISRSNGKIDNRNISVAKLLVDCENTNKWVMEENNVKLF